MRSPDSWLPFYPGDYFRRTNHLTTEQHGAYLLLLFECWGRGGVLPADDATLATLARMKLATWIKHRERVLAFFKLGPDGYSQSRLLAELAEASERYHRRSEAGRKGGKGKQCLSNAKAGLKQPQPQPHSPTFGGEEEASQGEGNPEGGSIIPFARREG